MPLAAMDVTKYPVGDFDKLETPGTPTYKPLPINSPETFQGRKTGSGKKIQISICPYPRTWAEADSVDRDFVRLKRHEGKSWEELFEWWRAMGRKSLKNGGCFAVRYFILERNYEEIWIAEGI